MTRISQSENLYKSSRESVEGHGRNDEDRLPSNTSAGEGQAVSHPVSGAGGGAALGAQGGRPARGGGELCENGTAGRTIVRVHVEDGAIGRFECGGLGPGGPVETDRAERAAAVAVRDADA